MWAAWMKFAASTSRRVEAHSGADGEIDLTDGICFWRRVAVARHSRRAWVMSSVAVSHLGQILEVTCWGVCQEGCVAR